MFDQIQIFSMLSRHYREKEEMEKPHLYFLSPQLLPMSLNNFLASPYLPSVSENILRVDMHQM